MSLQIWYHSTKAKSTWNHLVLRAVLSIQIIVFVFLKHIFYSGIIKQTKMHKQWIHLTFIYFTNTQKICYGSPNLSFRFFFHCTLILLAELLIIQHLARWSKKISRPALSFWLLAPLNHFGHGTTNHSATILYLGQNTRLA